MTPAYRAYLAANILNEDRIVTYRTLSQAHGIHANAAKEMLFEFHHQQNSKKPGSVYATYIVAGRKKRDDVTTNGNGIAKNGEDEMMQSSPFQSSPAAIPEEAAEEVPVFSVTLVREDDFTDVQSQYDVITSTHIYSLGPSPLKDLQILSDSARELRENNSTGEAKPIDATAGIISNSGARRRRGVRPMPVQASTVEPVKPMKSSKTAEPEKEISSAKLTDSKESTAPKEAIAKTITTTSSQGTKSTTASAKEFFGKSAAAKKSAPTLKKESSSLLKAFAKAPPPKLKREGTDSSAVISAASDAENSPMKDASDDEEDTYVAPPPASKEKVDADRRSRKEREAALKKMMEEDDDDEEEKTDEPVPDDPEPVEPEPSQSTQEQPKEAVETSGVSRRGRRRVMKKKTMKDDEGYLVTVEEPAWESFSEDEPSVAKAKPISQSSSGTAKVKKGPSKPGQGNIMAFFGKK